MFLILILIGAVTGLADTTGSDSLAPAAEPKAVCDDIQKIYKICSDQVELYNLDKKKALESKKPLLVVFGTEWCPRCRELHRATQRMGDKAVIRPIAAMHGYEVKDESERLFARLAAQSNVPASVRQRRSFPLVFLVDPNSGRTRYIPLATLFERRDGQSKINGYRLIHEIELGVPPLPSQ